MKVNETDMTNRYIKVSEHSVYLPAISRESPSVVDLGANEGTFSIWAADALNANVYAVEALPELASQLAADSRIRVLHAAASGASGIQQIYRAVGRCASATLNPMDTTNAVTVSAVTLDDIRDRFGLDEIDLVKIDIEGSELDVLSQCSVQCLQSITQITCEFHDFLDISHRPRIRSVCRRLSAAGFFCVPMAKTTWGDTVFLNRAKLDDPRIVQAEMWGYKILHGTRRAIRRGSRFLTSVTAGGNHTA